MRNFTVGIFLSLCFLTCKQAPKDQTKGAAKTQKTEIDLIGNLANQVEDIPLSRAARSIDIVPLETREECMIENMEGIIITDEDIIIMDNYKKPLLRFSREGKFLNTIVPIGRGPQECLMILQATYDSSKKQIYVTPGDGIQPIKVYDLTGKFIKSIPFDAHTQFASIYGNLYYSKSTFFWNLQLPLANPKNPMWNFAIADSNLNAIKTFRNPEYQGRDQELIEKGGGNIGWDNWYEEYNPIDFYREQIKIMYHGGDTIYRFDWENQDFVPQYTLKLGARPSFAVCRDRWKKNSFFQYLWIDDFDETRDFLYFYGHKDKNRYIFEFDKNTGNVQTKRYKGELTEWKSIDAQNITIRNLLKAEEEGFKNDLCGMPAYFHITGREQNTLLGSLVVLSDGKAWVNMVHAYVLIEKTDIEKLKATEVLHPETRDRFIEILSTLTENSNPVLFIANLK